MKKENDFRIYEKWWFWLIIFLILFFKFESISSDILDNSDEINKIKNQVDDLQNQVDYQNEYLLLLQKKLKNQEIASGWYYTIPPYNP